MNAKDSTPGPDLTGQPSGSDSARAITESPTKLPTTTHPETLSEPSPAQVQLRQQILAARRAGTRDAIIETLSVSQIDEPIDLDSDVEPDEAISKSIEGYRLVREISRGGQATVYEGLDEGTRRRVAIKIIIGGRYLSSRARARFEREVRTLARLDHPGVVGVLNKGRTSDGSFYLVTDFIEGDPLDLYLERARTEGMTQADVVRLFAKIATAVEEAHLQRIIHRDLKPSNILVDKRGEPHVLDFGLARLIDPDAPTPWPAREVTVTGNVIGSLPWASPEQARGDIVQLGAASDVYALGVMLYQALIGQFPYPVACPIHELTRNICEESPRVPKAGEPLPFGTIPQLLWEINMAALAKNAAERPATAGAFAMLLTEALAGRHVAKSRPGRRWPARSGGLVVVGLVLIVIAVLRVDVSSHTRPLPHPFSSFQNSLGMKFVLIQAGAFNMGASAESAAGSLDEAWHKVRLTQAFYIATTEVTRGQYQAVMGNRDAQAASSDNAHVAVDRISRDDALEFCRRLSSTERRPYRLPTEAEWEYACRAETVGDFSGTGKILEMGWISRSGRDQPRRIAMKRPNDYGLYDTHGNVAEWCADDYIESLREKSVTDPLHIDPASPGVIRGGSVLDSADRCRSASRQPLAAAERQPGVGFRVVVGHSASVVPSQK